MNERCPHPPAAYFFDLRHYPPPCFWSMCGKKDCYWNLEAFCRFRRFQTLFSEVWRLGEGEITWGNLGFVLLGGNWLRFSGAKSSADNFRLVCWLFAKVLESVKTVRFFIHQLKMLWIFHSWPPNISIHSILMRFIRSNFCLFKAYWLIAMWICTALSYFAPFGTNLIEIGTILM